MSILRNLSIAALVSGCSPLNPLFSSAGEVEVTPRDPIPTSEQAALEAGGNAYSDSLEPHCEGFKDEHLKLSCFEQVAEGRAIAAAASAAARAQTDGRCDIVFNADGTYDVIADEISDATIGAGMDCSAVLTPSDVLEIMGASAQAAGWKAPVM